MFNAPIEVFTLAEVNSKFANLPKFELLTVFKLVIEVFTLAEVNSKFVNLPKFELLTTFKASMLIC